MDDAGVSVGSRAKVSTMHKSSRCRNYVARNYILELEMIVECIYASSPEPLDHRNFTYVPGVF